jgi:hypothetical protein
MASTDASSRRAAAAWPTLARVARSWIVVGVGALVVAGCASATIDRDDYALPVTALSEVTLGRSVTSLTVVEAEVGFDEVSDVVTTVIGERCAGADDPVACMAEHDRLLATDPDEWPVVGQCVMCASEPARLLVVTGPDGARIVEGPEVAAALAPIDRDREVELVFGQPVRVRADGDGWRFVSSRIVETCDPIVERTTLYAMTADGAFEEVRSVDSTEEDVCI